MRSGVWHEACAGSGITLGLRVPTDSVAARARNNSLLQF